MAQRSEVATGWRERTLERSLAQARQRSLETGERLVGAAIRLIARTSGTDFTVQELLDRSGVSLRAFYQQFTGKDDLLIAVLEETNRQAAETLREEAAQRAEAGGQGGVPGAFARLQVVLVALFSLDEHADHPIATALAGEYVRLSRTHPDALRTAARPVVGLIAELLGQGRAEGSVRDLDPERTATLLAHQAVVAYLNRTLLRVGEATGVPSGEELAEFCLRGLEPRKEPR